MRNKGGGKVRGADGWLVIHGLGLGELGMGERMMLFAALLYFFLTISNWKMRVGRDGNGAGIY
jgi:hypothetical protein